MRYMKIFAFADKKDNIKDKLKEKSDDLVYHLVKVFLFPNCEVKPHWCQEIYGFIHSVPKTKNKNKFPDKNFILNNTYEIWGDAIESCIVTAIKDYPNVVPLFDQHTGLNICETAVREYFEWLSEELSKIGRVASSDVYKKIDKLIEEVVQKLNNQTYTL